MALSAAQIEFPAIPRTETVQVKTERGSYTFSYAPLEAILSATKPILARHGLAVIQDMGDKGVSTIILHSSGQWLQLAPVKINERDGENAQATGSRLTYARRYSYTMALNLATDQDDDGGHASGNVTTRQAPGIESVWTIGLLAEATAKAEKGSYAEWWLERPEVWRDLAIKTPQHAELKAKNGKVQL